MIELLSYTVFFAIVLLIVNFATFNSVKNIYIQKLIFLHKKINEENISAFKLNHEFQVSLDFLQHPIPNIRKEHLGNHDYYITVNKFEQRKRIFKQVNIALIATLSVALIVGFILYP